MWTAAELRSGPYSDCRKKRIAYLVAAVADVEFHLIDSRKKNT